MSHARFDMHNEMTIGQARGDESGVLRVACGSAQDWIRDNSYMTIQHAWEANPRRDWAAWTFAMVLDAARAGAKPVPSAESLREQMYETASMYEALGLMPLAPTPDLPWMDEAAFATLLEVTREQRRVYGSLVGFDWRAAMAARGYTEYTDTNTTTTTEESMQNDTQVQATIDAAEVAALQARLDAALADADALRQQMQREQERARAARDSNVPTLHRLYSEAFDTTFPDALDTDEAYDRIAQLMRDDDDDFWKPVRTFNVTVTYTVTVETQVEARDEDDAEQAVRTDFDIEFDASTRGGWDAAVEVSCVDRENVEVEED